MRHRDRLPSPFTVNSTSMIPCTPRRAASGTIKSRFMAAASFLELIDPLDDGRYLGGLRLLLVKDPEGNGSVSPSGYRSSILDGRGELPEEGTLNGRLIEKGDRLDDAGLLDAPGGVDQELELDDAIDPLGRTPPGGY